MVVCDTSDQAKELFSYFEELHGQQNITEFNLAAEPEEKYGNKKLKAALILHDVNDRDFRKEAVKAFKAGEIDMLFVFNMLLTGFDAHRLKKLYLARVVKDHNLLQTLTRVNRPYKKYRYGYVVDFADISKAFKETNDNYFAELQSELGDEMSHYTSLFKSQEEIASEIQEIKEAVFSYDIKNAELFRLQIEQIKNKKDLNELIKVLQNAKELKNIIRLQGFDDLLAQIDFFKLNQLLGITKAQLDKLNLIDAINNDADTTNLLNSALEDIFFQFVKVSEEELIIADQLRNQLKKTREALQDNFDPKDPAFISLKQELERIFKKKNLDEVGQEDMRENIFLLNAIYDKAKELNRKNNLLKAKYEHDEKYARVHKRILARADVSTKEIQLYDALYNVKNLADAQLLNNHNLLDNEAYFNRNLLNLVSTEFVKNQKIKLDFNTTQAINTLIASEYLNQYHNRL
ncbi:type I restriction enzyme subunit R domain-containing protein [Pedobacter alpinus]|uniref:Restriction endonuclease type I HsdR second RecA-like helicase domain-containing protein n=1 Tax=Pedobacter alpinus TaxID=1590643 RepID=A0ABW5TV60_9SPHI